jgi:hypothetical protein
MELILDETDELVDVMLDRMSRFGINYKVNKPRDGVIPEIDIESVEKIIADIEGQIDNDPELAKVEYLMDLYSKAVEYYSATNNPKYEYYKEKIHNTLATPRMTEFLESEGNKTPRDEDEQPDDKCDATNGPNDMHEKISEGDNTVTNGNDDIDNKEDVTECGITAEVYTANDVDVSATVKESVEVDNKQVDHQSISSVKSIGLEKLEDSTANESKINHEKVAAKNKTIDESTNKIKVELADDEEVNIDYNEDDEDFDDE